MQIVTVEMDKFAEIKSVEGVDAVKMILKPQTLHKTYMTSFHGKTERFDPIKVYSMQKLMYKIQYWER